MLGYVLGAAAGWLTCKYLPQLKTAVDRVRASKLMQALPLQMSMPAPSPGVAIAPDAPAVPIVRAPLSAFGQTVVARIAQEGPNAVSSPEISQLQAELGVPTTGVFDATTQMALAPQPAGAGVSGFAMAGYGVGQSALPPGYIPAWGGGPHMGPSPHGRRYVPSWGGTRTSTVSPRHTGGGRRPPSSPGTGTHAN